MKKVMGLLLILLCIAASASATELQTNTAIVDIAGEQCFFIVEDAVDTRYGADKKEGVAMIRIKLTQMDQRTDSILKIMSLGIPMNWEKGDTFSTKDEWNSVYGQLKVTFKDWQTNKEYASSTINEMALIIDNATGDYGRLQGRLQGSMVERLPTSTMYKFDPGDSIKIGLSYFDFDLSVFPDFAKGDEATETGPIVFAPLE